MTEEKRKLPADSSPEREDGGAPSEPEPVTLPREEYDALKGSAAERDELFQKLQRTVADFDNYRKRVQRDRPLWESEKVKRFLRDILPAVDDLQRLMAALDEGISLEEVRTVLGLVSDKVAKTAGEWSIEAVGACGEAFDPNLHEALRQEQTDEIPPGSILEVLRTGYVMDGIVLRAAQVVVAQAPQGQDDQKTNEPEEEREEAATRKNAPQKE